MTSNSLVGRARDSLNRSTGTIVFGMEDGTVSIFGLVFGVAATTNDTRTVLIAGASGAAAAAVSMMAGAYLDAETTRDQTKAKKLPSSQSPNFLGSLSQRLAGMGLAEVDSEALLKAVQNEPGALRGLVCAVEGPEDARLNPGEQALWMLLADFLAAAIPIVPFVILPIHEARLVSSMVTALLLVSLGIGRAKIAKRGFIRTVCETVFIGVAAALAGVAISVLIDRLFT